MNIQQGLNFVKKITVWIIGVLFTTIVFSCSWIPRHYVNRNDKVVRVCEFPIYYVLKNVSDENIKSVTNGADYWNGILGKSKFVYKGKYTKTKVSSFVRFLVIEQFDKLPNRDEDDDEDEDESICGLAYANSSSSGCVEKPNIDLKSKCMKNSLEAETLVRHELGHIIGLDDSDNPMHLMYFEVLFERESFMITPENLPVNATESEIDKVRELYP